MAIALSASTTPCLNAQISSRIHSYSSKSSSFRSIQFPVQFRRVLIGGKGVPLPSGRRFRPLVVEAKKQTFSSLDELLSSSEKPVLVDFYATWCGPCQFMVPVLNEVSETLKDRVQIVKIDTEKYPNIANKYRIEALPTFIIFKDGKPFDRFEGALPAEQLIQRIENCLKVKQ